MEKICQFCGKPYETLTLKSKYCPACKGSGKRYAAQFKKRRQEDPVTDIYAKAYGRNYSLYKYKKSISKADLDEWRIQVLNLRSLYYDGEITLEQFEAFCFKNISPQQNAQDIKLINGCCNLDTNNYVIALDGRGYEVILRPMEPKETINHIKKAVTCSNCEWKDICIKDMQATGRIDCSRKQSKE